MDKHQNILTNRHLSGKTNRLITYFLLDQHHSLRKSTRGKENSIPNTNLAILQLPRHILVKTTNKKNYSIPPIFWGKKTKLKTIQLPPHLLGRITKQKNHSITPTFMSGIKQSKKTRRALALTNWSLAPTRRALALINIKIEAVKFFAFPSFQLLLPPLFRLF